MNSKRNLKVFAAVIITVIAAAVAFFYFVADDNVQTPAAHSQLTGIEVEPEVAERPVLGVIIENTPAARPQTGLVDAGITFEVVTEGGITRTLALYQEDMPEAVGPIRSLRPYFLDWVMGFDASFAHVGGSPEALELAEERDAKSLNQFKFDGPYYRTEDRRAPHNMYANTQDLRELQEELGHDTSRFVEIPRSDGNPSENPQAPDITIEYSGPEYEVEFRYQPAENSYVRYLAGEPHIDAVTNEPVTVSNLTVIKLPSDSSEVEAIGSGEALVFKDGRAIQAEWQKNDSDERIQIVDEGGSQVPLNRGKSWFAVLPEDRSVTY